MDEGLVLKTSKSRKRFKSSILFASAKKLERSSAVESVSDTHAVNGSNPFAPTNWDVAQRQSTGFIGPDDIGSIPVIPTIRNVAQW